MLLINLVKPYLPRLTLAKTNSNFHKERFTSGVLQHVEEQFSSIPKEDKNKVTFHAALTIYSQNKANVRGHVEFITTALKHMKEFGLHKDLDTYKSLLNIFPKGPLIPQNKVQKIFLHHPQQQNCCIKVLDEMEWNCVQPDKEVHDIVSMTFGEWNFATKKIKRMLYWMPKLRHTNKYLDRRDVDNQKHDGKTLAKMALEMMIRDGGVQVKYAKAVRGDGKSSFIVSGQSPLQKRILFNLIKEYKNVTLNVDGPAIVYLSDHSIKYMVLSCDDPSYVKGSSSLMDNDTYYETDAIKIGIANEVTKEKNVHYQDGKIILAMAVLQENTKEAAMAWMRHLQENNLNLVKANIFFRINEGSNTVVVQEIERIEKDVKDVN